MNLFEGIKRTIRERTLTAKVKKCNRSVKACNLKDAKKIGILFNATHAVSFEIVKGLVKELSTNKKEIMVLGYVDSKQMIDHYLYRKGFEFFTKTHLNWYLKPEGDSINDFIDTPFDLLINLSLEENYPLKYILALSKASFKVGMYSENQLYLDLMIDIEKEKAAMNELQAELEKDAREQKKHLTNYDSIANQKSSIEIQLNFLINQLIHYLSLIKYKS